MTEEEIERANIEVAIRWCKARGSGWGVINTAGRGGTAPVFSINTPDGVQALKIYDEQFSSGERGEEQQKRIQKQKELGEHECPYLVKIYDAGRFDDRFYILMNKAPGTELEKILPDVPRTAIRNIIHQVATAMQFLREKGLCHRDVKSANVFLSDDYLHTTLLDVSVIRDIHDPIGIGTDHGDQLPVVATARYSPPEYLFRLEDPSPETWHALDVYQLGALLHDLIVRKPLFWNEYEAAKENRYRFAWIVATVTPEVIADDVELDLLSLARRALNKDWRARSQLSLHDFMESRDKQQRHALQMLGLDGASVSKVNISPHIEAMYLLSSIVKEIELGLIGYLRKTGVLAKHECQSISNNLKKVISFRWKIPAGTFFTIETVSCLDVALEAIPLNSITNILVTLTLTAQDVEKPLSASFSLPQFISNNNVSTRIIEDIIGSLPELARQLVQPES